MRINIPKLHGRQTIIFSPAILRAAARPTVAAWSLYASPADTLRKPSGKFRVIGSLLQNTEVLFGVQHGLNNHFVHDLIPSLSSGSGATCRRLESFPTHQSLDHLDCDVMREAVPPSFRVLTSVLLPFALHASS